ncbi:adenine-specific methyltransferase EcoRI family protein [Ligilactobacillus cholophilus]|uniref:adenine-specific methyltransferase EcoRI family protein n=1 Tax=Ligilactobacillus cholophilus TaxID=3050131 RepID=UPI0025B25E2A|nr:adenine-specific methyltransferase EcoRI family protein [Ligilactobacillus cholophilus]
MGRKNNLAAAQKSKKDEFYTMWSDIEREINAYLDFDPNVFKNKVILLPCDDPFESDFFKYFATKFKDLGIKKLIAVSYAGSPFCNTELQLSLFDSLEESKKKAYKIVISDAIDYNNDGIYNFDDIRDLLKDERIKLANNENSKCLTIINGNDNYLAGDFRSKEVTKLRDEADIIVTNPPFSLFREFIKWIEIDKRKCIIFANNNAISYKEVFPLIKENKIWLGATITNKSLHFRIPYNYDKWDEKFTDQMNDGNKYAKVSGISVFTNIDHGKRHAIINYMTEADNLRFSKHKEIRELGYRKYDNYDAIEVPFSDAIPSDYNGIIGVPISFLANYNPNQFRIVGLTQSWTKQAKKIYPKQLQISEDGSEKEVTKLNDGPAIKVDKKPNKGTYYTVNGNIYIKKYSRILIKKID